MSMSNDRIYFAAKEAKDTASILLGKSGQWQLSLESTGYTEKLRSMWAAYYGAYFTDVGSGHQITFSGEQGELVNLPVNHLRNLGQHILVITTQNRPTMQARSTNSDYRSLSQTILANGLLDYYMREKRLERYLKTAVETAIVLGSGFLKLEWNATSGQVVDFNEEIQTDIYEGDIEFTNLSPFDVVFDNTKEGTDQDWYLCRSFKNRFDLIAKYPELEQKILGLSSKSDVMSKELRFTNLGIDDTDDIPVYEFYHKRSESIPDGRYLLFLENEIVLVDAPLPYRDLPVFRIAPSNILGTPFGYTPLFDVLPVQEAINTLYSVILSNQNAFGVQNIYLPRGADITMSQLTGGLNIIEGNAGAGEPKPLNLTQTPAEIFKFLEMLEQTSETLSGVNSVARGNPEASLKSGSALALVQSMTLQFLSGLQQSYIQLTEDVGTAIVNMLKDYASVPRVAAIVGKNNRSYMKEFKGEDLSSINRVIVDVGNPLARTTAGRVQMAEQMLQMNLIKTPEQYFTVINTGSLDVTFEGTQSELLLIKAENEKMMEGEEVIVIDIDEHMKHIVEHRSLLADPELRKDPKLVQLVLQHITEHLNSLRNVDPQLLQLLGQQSLQQQPQPNQPSQPPSEVMDQSNQYESVQGADGGIANLPNQPTPPAPFEQLPVTADQMISQ